MLFSLILSSLLSPSAAPASPAPPPTSVIEVRCPEDAAVSAVASAAREHLVARGHGVDVEELGAAECPTGALRRVRGLLESARGHFASVQLKRAKRDAESALAVFTQAQSLFGDRQAFVDTRLLLAWIALELRVKAAVGQNFAAVLAVEPELELDADRYPPEVRRAFAAAAARAVREKATVTIITRPAAATVFVDERETCTSPCESLALPAGAHFVKVVAEGSRDAHSVVQARAGERVTVELELTPRRAADLRLELSPSPRSDSAQVIVAAGLSAGEQVTLSVRDVAALLDGWLAKLAPPPAARPEVPSAVSSPLPDVLASSPGEAPPVEPAQVGPSWWPWIAGGVAVVLGASLLTYQLTRPDFIEVSVTPP